VITIIDLNRELAKLNTLRGRTPQTTSAERTGSAARLAPYRDGAIFSSKFAGKGDWERHPNGDEFVQIIDGAASLEIVPLDGPRQRVELKAGTLAIVPQGAWHRFQSADGITLITATPQPSDHVRCGGRRWSRYSISRTRSEKCR
jgi:mannose-6-phosphate isomerase-like protein (cupin superfamily)